MNETRDQPLERLAVRTIADAETLKVLADPLRLAMLTTLMRGPRDPRIMSVKELAEELGEPQTKLYRHVKQLEAAGLIQVAATRLVSGILEQRYQACQTGLKFGPGLLSEHATADDATAVLAALFDEYRERFFTAYRDGRIDSSAEYPPGKSYRKPLLSIAETRVSEARAAEIRDRLQQWLDDLLSEPEAGLADGVPVTALISFYSPAEPDAG